MRIAARPRPRLHLLALVSVALLSALVWHRARTPEPSAPAAPVSSPATVPVPAPVADSAAPELAALIADFTSAEYYPRVYRATEAFERDPARAIPALVALLDRQDRVELVSTADLIYPGAERSYGHGTVVWYELDSISVRAGWMLESLAFQDFGFRSGRGHDPLAVERARDWWRAGIGIARRDAILAALDSRDADRRRDALSYLANLCTSAPIPGLDGASSRRDLEPRLRRLARHGSPDERERARDALAYPPWRDVCDD